MLCMILYSFSKEVSWFPVEYSLLSFIFSWQLKMCSITQYVHLFFALLLLKSYHPCSLESLKIIEFLYIILQENCEKARKQTSLPQYLQSFFFMPHLWRFSLCGFICLAHFSHCSSLSHVRELRIFKINASIPTPSN